MVPFSSSHQLQNDILEQTTIDMGVFGNGVSTQEADLVGENDGSPADVGVRYVQTNPNSK